MVKVKFVSTLDYISYIEIKGHAESNKKGHDLVCSAISAITLGTIQALEKVSKKDIQVIDGEVTIRPSKKITYEDNVRLKMMIKQLQVLEVGYPNCIKVKKEKKV